jgi:hypothetical protein
MKVLLLFCWLFNSAGGFSQRIVTADTDPAKTPKKISFVTKVDIRQRTKDGIYLNGYLVNLGYEKIKALNGKTVRIKGKVSIVKGIGEYTGKEVRQGRSGDTKYIHSPKIKIIDD